MGEHRFTAFITRLENCWCVWTLCRITPILSLSNIYTFPPPCHLLQTQQITLKATYSSRVLWSVRPCSECTSPRILLQEHETRTPASGQMWPCDCVRFKLPAVLLEWSRCGQGPAKRNFLLPWLGSGTDTWEHDSFGLLGDDFNCLWPDPTLLLGNHRTPHWSHRQKQVPSLVGSHSSVRAACKN